MNGFDENVAAVGKPNGGEGGGIHSGGSGLQSKIHDIDTRLGRIEERLKHAATTEWILAGVIGAIVTASMLALAVLKLFGE